MLVRGCQVSEENAADKRIGPKVVDMVLKMLTQIENQQ
jgi:hypothetical protein